MSEAYLDIHFSCQNEHTGDWETVFNMLEKGNRGWQLQDAIDPISEDAADSLDNVWEKLEYGSDAFEVFVAEVNDTKCHLQLMTGGMVIDELAKNLIEWLKTCPIKEVKSSISYDSE